MRRQPTYVRRRREHPLATFPTIASSLATAATPSHPDCRALRILIVALHLCVLTGQGARIDTSTAGGRLVFGVFAALAEFERELIRERTLAGLRPRRRGAGRVAGSSRSRSPGTPRAGGDGEPRHLGGGAMPGVGDRPCDALPLRGPDWRPPRVQKEGLGHLESENTEKHGLLACRQRRRAGRAQRAKRL